MLEPENTNFKSQFLDGAGNPTTGKKGIAPIFTLDNNNRIIFLGTGFFITRGGLMLTAKHCLFDKKAKSYNTLFIIQFLDQNNWIRRPMFRSYWNSSDLTVLIPNNSIPRETAKKFRNPVLPMTTKKPAIGEKIASLGYPKTTILTQEDKISINTELIWHFGQVEDFHPQGTHLLKNSCYQTSMHILGGSSGGPVVNSEGKVFAINSTGSDVIEGLQPYSFSTPIEHCLDLQVDGDNGVKYSIKELIDLNEILCEI